MLWLGWRGGRRGLLRRSDLNGEMRTFQQIPGENKHSGKCRCDDDKVVSVHLGVSLGAKTALYLNGRSDALTHINSV